MTIRHHFSGLLLIFLSSLLVACIQKHTPAEVTKKFWTAVQNQNVANIRKYSLDSNHGAIGEVNNLPGIKSISIGKIVIDGDEANIETTVIAQTENGERELQVITIMEKIDNNWLVDYSETTDPLLMNQDMMVIMDDIQEMTEEFTEEIEESVDEIKEKAIPEIKSRMEQAEKEIRDKLPELKNIIEEFLKQLEKSIEESIQEPEDKTTVET